MTQPTTSRRSPWTKPQLCLIAGVNGVGLLVLASAWLGAHETEALEEQVIWLSLAVMSVVVAATIQAQWLLYGRRATLARRRAVLGQADNRSLGDAPDAAAESAPTAWVTVSNGTRAHRPDCVLVWGKQIAPVGSDGPGERQPARLCEVCR